MKTCFVLTLLTFFICVESVNLFKSRRASSIRLARRTLTDAIFSEKDQTSLANEKPQKYYPPLRIDFNYRRSGSYYDIYYGVSIYECIEHCRNSSDTCLAINYINTARQCHLMERIGEIVPDSRQSTCFVSYPEGVDPCSDVYMYQNYTRYAFFYKASYKGKVESAKECCQKCMNEAQEGCLMWYYHTGPKNCFLQDAASILVADTEYTSGFGVLTSPSSFALSQTLKIRRRRM